MHCRFRITIFFLLILCFLAPQYLFAQTVHIADPEKEAYFNKLSVVSQRLQATNAKRLTKLAAINRSYEKTQQAITLFNDPSKRQEVLGLLEKAIRRYPSNRIALLLLGTFYENIQGFEKAKVQYENFLQKSLLPSEVEKDLMSPAEVEYFRSRIARWFEQHGYELPKPKVPFSFRFRRGLQRLHVFPKESSLGVTLTVIVYLGLAILLFSKAINFYETRLFQHPVAVFLLHYYFVAVGAYLLWMTHLFLGLQPFWGGTLTREIVSVLVIGFIVILFFEVAQKKKVRAQALKNPENQACPKCGRIIMKLAAECPYCKERV